MKVGLALALALFIPAFVHGDTSPLRLESSVPSIEIVFAGQGSDLVTGAFYHFAVRDNSAHSITGFHVFQVPESVQKVDGRYACNTGCGSTFLIGNNSDPMMSPGGAFDLHVSVEDAARWPTLWADAAIFDDYTYEGDEHVASRLALQQIGNQAAFDQIKPLIDVASSDSSLNDSGKAEQLRSELSALSIEVEPTMIQRFNYWFPNLPDCGHEFGRVMAGAAAAAKEVIARDLDKLISGGYPGSSFSLWAQKTNAYLKQAHIGCRGCNNVPAAASSAASEFQPCPSAGGQNRNPQP